MVVLGAVRILSACPVLADGSRQIRKSRENKRYQYLVQAVMSPLCCCATDAGYCDSFSRCHIRLVLIQQKGKGFFLNRPLCAIRRMAKSARYCTKGSSD